MGTHARKIFGRSSIKVGHFAYFSAKADTNNHNEEMLAQLKKILSTGETKSQMKEGLTEANHKEPKVGRQVQDIEDKITVLKSKIATPATSYKMRKLQANLELCRQWRSKTPHEIVICKTIMAKCKEFIDAADESEMNHLVQRHFSNWSDEEMVDEFEQHGEHWMQEGSRALEVLNSVSQEVLRD